jgi:hypothetical protein
MKEWFKHEFGYVNIDSENLYLTNTGNWSETKILTEKTKKVASQNDARSSSIIGFMIMVLCILAYLNFKNIVSGRVAVTLIILSIIGCYKLYDYLKAEIGAKFKIPHENISEIKINNRSIEIIFINGEGKNDNYKLHKVEEKGIAIMISLPKYVA